MPRRWLPKAERLTARLTIGITLLVIVPLAGGLYLLSRDHYQNTVAARRTAAELETRMLEAALRHQMLKRDPRPTAIVCPHDRVALLAAVTARRAGLRVPQDLAVVGHYDLPDARLAEAPLTTFDAQVDQVGTLAFKLLHERLTGKRSEPKQIRIEPKLVVRASSGAAQL